LSKISLSFHLSLSAWAAFIGRGSRFFFVLAAFRVSADKLPARNDRTQQARNMGVCRAFIAQTELQTGISGELQPACNKMKCRDGREKEKTPYICNTK